MVEQSGRRRPLRFAAALAAGLIAIAAGGVPASADAGFVVGFGLPYPGFYAAPWEYYPPPAYPPYPAPPYYPSTSGYYPRPAEPYAESATTTPASASITYTDRPAFINAAGQPCREYRAGNGAVGTACRAADGQWRVAY